MDLEPPDMGEVVLDFRWHGKREEPAVVEFCRPPALAAGLFHEREVDSAWRIVVAHRVRHAGYSQPVGRQNFRRHLDPDRQPLPVVLPVRVDGGLVRRAWNLLLVQRVQQLVQPVRPASHEIDPLKLPDAEHLFELLEPKRNDESRVFQLLRQILGDTDLLLHPVLVERGVAAA